MSGSGASPMAAQLAAQEMRTKVQQATETVLKRNLSLDEFNAFCSRRDQAASFKRVSVYGADANGKLERKAITIGLSDGNNSEIVDGAREGEVYVLKAHAANEKKVKTPGAMVGQ